MAAMSSIHGCGGGGADGKAPTTAEELGMPLRPWRDRARSTCLVEGGGSLGESMAGFMSRQHSAPPTLVLMI